jgi:hypothetical protein
MLNRAERYHRRRVTGTDSDAWTPRWDAIADRLVNGAFRLQPGERVIYLVEPSLYPGLLDAVRSHVLRAGGIEQATMLPWTPALASLRDPKGWAPDPAVHQRELYAHADLFNTADVFMWLPTDDFGRLSTAVWESEWILGRWQGRGMHFHWFTDPGSPPDAPIHLELQKIYERAILELDYAALAQRQQRLVEAVRGRRLRVSTPDGTDLSFDLPANAWFHCNDGDASREKALRAVCARDREEEMPCGAVRGVPAPNAVDGVIGGRRTGMVTAWTSPFSASTWTWCSATATSARSAPATARPRSTPSGRSTRATMTAWARSSSAPTRS